MGFNEAGLLRRKWHDLERDGRHGVPYRATTRRSEVRVQSPAGKRVLVMRFFRGVLLYWKNHSLEKSDCML